MVVKVSSAKAERIFNVMAPLLVGDPADPYSEESRKAWLRFAEVLAEIKKMGFTAVSTDVWWGLVEKSERQYDWKYYDRLSDYIIAAGLKWVPIISLHRCGGNIGDDAYVPIPAWVWAKLAGMIPSRNVNAVRYVSEQGNASDEYVACWATELVLPDYIALFVEFQKHFANKAKHIAEINISLGPAGELRFPSYNNHDKGTDFPTRGALQIYSELARKSWGAWVLAKYVDRAGVLKAWGPFANIEPPVDCNAFFANGDHINKQYGRDLFDWQRESLISHGRMVLTAANETFDSDGSAFKGIDIGAKVPGVHWRTGYWDNDKIVLGDRLAELAAALISTGDKGLWTPGTDGQGYGPIIALFKEVGVVLHFTCLEMTDHKTEWKDNQQITCDSLAKQLVRWVGKEAKRQDVRIKGENALASNLGNHDAWVLMRDALGAPAVDDFFVDVHDQGLEEYLDSAYEGITLLRMTDVVPDESLDPESGEAKAKKLAHDEALATIKAARDLALEEAAGETPAATTDNTQAAAPAASTQPAAPAASTQSAAPAADNVVTITPSDGGSDKDKPAA